MKKINYSPEELKWRLIGFLGKHILSLLFGSMRIETVGLEKAKHVYLSGNVIFAFWHARILGASWWFQGYDGAIMVSASDDGEIISRVLEKQGHQTVRGSTTRGGMRALAELIRVVRERRCHACIIPDGPQGPRHKVQPGIVRLAQKAGIPLIPFTYSARHMKVFKSWDRFILPIPFSKAVFMFGDPIYVPEKLSRDEERKLTQLLESKMVDLTLAADAHYGRRID